MSADITLRLTLTEDAEDFHRIEVDAAGRLTEAPEIAGMPIPPATSAHQYARIIGKRRSLTARVGHEIAGFAAIVPERRELHVHQLSVAGRFQRRGVGTLLLRALIVDGRNSGFRAITLTTCRDIDWHASFYARQGFVEVVDLAEHARLARVLDEADAIGLPRERRCAMIRFIA